MKNKLLNIALVFFICVFLYSGGKLAFRRIDQYKTKQKYEQMQALTQQEYQEPTLITPAEKYGALYEQNQDFVGWISIPDTQLNYPVMQSVKIREYYLRRNFDKQYSYSGTPFMEEKCKIGQSDNLIIYAHNMTNGTMFGDLTKYLYRPFYDSHQYLSFDTMDSFNTYQIFVVFKTQVYTDHDFEYYTFIDAEDEDEFNQFIDTCREMALYTTGVDVHYGDKLITLSTCEYSQDNGRLVVVAKLVDSSPTTIVQ